MSLDTYLSGLNQQRQPAPAPSAPSQSAAPPPPKAPAPAPAPAPAQSNQDDSARPLPGSQLSDFLSFKGPGYMGPTQASQDWFSRYGNDVLWGGMDPLTAASGGGDLATLRTQREAMDARMSPLAKTSADIIAQYTAPQNILLNRIPYFGGALQGGGQAFGQALGAGKDLSTATKEGVAGAGAGLISQGAAAMVPAIPKVAAPLAAETLERAPQTALGMILGHAIGPEGYGHVAEGAGALAGLLDKSATLSAAPYLKTAADWVRKTGEADWSAAKPAIRSLLLGLTNTGLQEGMPNVPGQWVPGQ